jgi:hypothetical protein
LASWADAQKKKILWDVLPISLVRIIANPEALDGRRVRVIGYAQYGGGLDRSIALYVTEADGRVVNDNNAISVKGESAMATIRPFLGKTVIFNCTYRAPIGGYESGSNGDLENIKDVQEWSFGDIKR